MECNWEEHGMPDERGWRTVRCKCCKLIILSPHAYEDIHSTCRCVGVSGRAVNLLSFFGLTQERMKWAKSFFVKPLEDEEVAALFPGETDRTLIGNRLKELFAAMGVPPCGGCEARAAWMNAAHQWLRERF